MANTYKALATVTVGAGGATTIDFTNIPQTYTDLFIVYSLRSTGAVSQTNAFVYFNNNTSVSYSYLILQGAGNAVGSSSSNNVAIEITQIPGANATANTFSNSSIYITNYNSNTNKSVSADGVQENNQTVAYAQMVAGSWANTSPITSIGLSQFSANNFAQYSTATLYGVFNADVSTAPATPTIGTATAGNTSASITFTGVSNAASYTMTSTPGSITATGSTSPITVSGLTNGTAYTFKVKANNPFGSSAESAASNSVTPVGIFNAISTSTLTSNTTTVTFSNIPQTYKHLVVRAYTKPTNVNLTNGQGSVAVYANGSSSGYRWSRSYGSARDAGSGAYAGAVYLDTFNTAEFWVNTYTDTSLTKQIYGTSSFVSQTAVTNGSFVFQISTNNTSGDTSAVTSLSLTNTEGWQFANGSIFMLYGVGE